MTKINQMVSDGTLEVYRTRNRELETKIAEALKILEQTHNSYLTNDLFCFDYWYPKIKSCLAC